MASGEPRRGIVYLADVLGGGTGNHLLSMLRHMDRSGLDAHIISQVPATARVQADVPVEIIPALRGFSRYPVGQLRRLRWLAGAMRRRRPDLLHTFFFWSIIYGRLLKRLGAVRYLVENREDQGFNWGRHEYALLRATRSLPDRVVCVSNAVRQVVLEREGLEPERVVVLHNGITDVHPRREERDAVRAEFGFGGEHLIVGMVANLNRAVKGVGFFVDAMPLIVREVPNARFLILGRGQEEQMLRDRADALGVGAHVVFAGFREDIDRCYAAMDVSVLTSLSEGLSLTLLESSAYSVPIVATHVGGNAEVVEEGRTGFLVPAENPPAFAERVVQLLRDPSLRARMGAEGQRKIARQFQMSDVAARYRTLYAEVMNHGPR